MTPPSTPTPRRFLLAKRGATTTTTAAIAGTQSSQTPTPRFHSTQRFVGSSSVPRPTQGRQGQQGADDIEEVDEVVEESSQEGDGGGEEGGGEGEIRKARRRILPLGESIEDGSDVDVDSRGSSPRSLLLLEEDDDEEEEEPGTAIAGTGRNRRSLEPDDSSDYDDDVYQKREAKRRRLAISPSSPFAPFKDAVSERDMTPNEEGSISSNQNHTPRQDYSPSEHHFDNHEEEDSFVDMGFPKTQQQPTFFTAPRFKPVDHQFDASTEGLPVAFSPHRRGGARYISGGLAAEVQGWLSEVKGWEGIDRPEDVVSKMTVEHVRPGRMYLATCRLESANVLRRFVLAGEGKLTGLGRRADVRVGSVVVVGEPVWDTEIDGELWSVACDWSIA